MAGQQLNTFKPTKLGLKVVKCIQDTESCSKESEKLEEPSTALVHNPSGESKVHTKQHRFVLTFVIPQNRIMHCPM